MERLELLQMLHWVAGDENYEIDGQKFENQPVYVNPKIFSSFAEDAMNVAAEKALARWLIDYLTEGKHQHLIENHLKTFLALIKSEKLKWDKRNEKFVENKVE